MIKSALLALALTLPALAAPAPEYRAFWVDTFNSHFGARADVTRILDAALASNANAVFVQVRRRGDAWYLDAKEPLPDVEGFGEPDASGRPTYDPLRDLITQAHSLGIEVHAFTIVGSVWRDDRPPSQPSHVFNQHIWDAAANAPYRDARQWATRALPHKARGTSWDGQRFGREWYIDLGHPDAEAYTVDVLTHLVARYELDGIHLDRIRYPESPLDKGGANVGYNAVSVARFRKRYGDTASYDADGQPRSTDRLWSQWRRDQVTAFLRRLYINVKAVRPSIRVSAATICYGQGPNASGGFHHTDAWSYVFQDWKGWAEEGLLDVLAPMDYKREAVKAQAAQFDDWSRFTAATARDNGRLGVVGIGAYLNTALHSVRQIRRATGSGADGVIFFSLGGVTRSGDADAYFAVLRDGAFSRPVPTPPLRTRGGHAMGFLHHADGSPVDGGTVAIENVSTHATRTATTDGGGFWGAVHVPAGSYRATVTIDNVRKTATFVINDDAVTNVAMP